MNTFQEYRIDFTNTIRSDSSRNSRTPKEEFLFQMLEKIEDREEIFDPKVQFLWAKGRYGRQMQVDAYAFDENDKSIVLVLNDYSDSLNEDDTLTRGKIDQLKNRMLYFLEEAYDNKLSEYLDDSDEFITIGRDLKRRLDLDIPLYDIDETVEKIKLFILTNSKLSDRVKTYIPDERFKNRQIQVNIWSIDRLYELFISGSNKEPIEIKLSDFQVEGLPCLKAEMSDNSEYDAFLVIVPGKLLGDMYYRYGSRLLEGNVRAFLGVKNKVNKGIRDTIIKNPKKFFTYNNGIAGTAESVQVEKIGDSSYITAIHDLQIINGGQTTASLTSAAFRKESDLRDIFVPMKLTVIKNKDEYSKMVSDISRFANNQSKVVESDFFSNHLFHIEFERLSKKIPAPAVAGNTYETYWYYERSRGKYDQEQFKLKAGTKEKDEFQRKYPKKQVIKKEELSKYINSVDMKPHIVSLGSAKCTDFFAKSIEALWDKGDTGKAQINEYYFKRAVASAIMFRDTDNIVLKSSWYPKGGNKSNIVTYTIAMIMSRIPSGYQLDFQYIFKLQSLYPALICEIEKVSYLVNQFLETNARGKIVAMYARIASTWDKMRDELDYQPSSDFLHSLRNIEDMKDINRAAARDAKIGIEVDLMKEMFSISLSQWEKVLKEGKERKIIDYKDQGMIELTIKWISGKISYNLTKPQMKIAWEAKKKVEDAGVII